MYPEHLEIKLFLRVRKISKKNQLVIVTCVIETCIASSVFLHDSPMPVSGR